MPSAYEIRTRPARRGAFWASATATVVAIAVLPAGCGSSYSKQDFVERADGICANALSETRAIAPAAGPPQTNRALAAYLEHALPIIQSEAGQLRALRRPPGTDAQKAALARYLSALTGQVAAIKRLKQAAARDDADGVSAAEDALQASQATTLAAKYGLKSCAAPGSTAV